MSTNATNAITKEPIAFLIAASVLMLKKEGRYTAVADLKHIGGLIYDDFTFEATMHHTGGSKQQAVELMATSVVQLKNEGWGTAAAKIEEVGRIVYGDNALRRLFAMWRRRVETAG